VANRKPAPIVNADTSGKTAGESAESRARVRRGPDATLKKMSSDIAKNRDLFSVESLSKVFSKHRNSKAD
jgi:hypothetical protein